MNGTLVIWVLIGLLVALWGIRWLLYRGLTPPRLPHPPQTPSCQQATAVTWTGPNARRLHAIWLPASGDRVAVAMHGWGGNASVLLPAARALHAAGWSVLLPDARGHGQSEADSHSSLPRFAEDLDSAIDWVLATRGSAYTKVALLGHSVGAAAVLLCASRRPEPCAVVAVSCFDHPERVMRRWLDAHHVPYRPLGWVINRYVEWVIGRPFEEIAPTHTIRSVNAPLLLVHGTRDTVVPLDALQSLLRVNPGAEGWDWPGDHEHFDDEPRLLAQLGDWLAARCG